MKTTKLCLKYGWNEHTILKLRQKHLIEGKHFERLKRKLGGTDEIDYTYSGIQELKKHLAPKYCKHEGCTTVVNCNGKYCYDHSPERLRAIQREESNTDQPGRFVPTPIGIEMRSIMLLSNYSLKEACGMEQQLPPRRSCRNIR